VEFILANFGGIVVIDEAYNDFSDKQSFINLVDEYNNLILMQTFSKAMGLAGARVGMAFTNPEIVKLFNKLKPPYNISAINQKAALDKLQKLDDYRLQVMMIKKERERLETELGKLEITEKIYPSDANFLLVRMKNATSIYNELVKKNIIVRNRSNVIDNCLRITVGKKNENDQLIKALKEIIA
jgi:histidinol-phosphate aminotransferase